jgi:predicted Zn-dependent protease
VDRGLFAPFGRNARLIRQSEAEADRLSLYLMDRAGYDPAAAPAFWRRVAHADPMSDVDPTHPRWRVRLAALQVEADRISAARRAGRTPELPPELQEAIETATSP